MPLRAERNHNTLLLAADQTSTRRTSSSGCDRPQIPIKSALLSVTVRMQMTGEGLQPLTRVNRETEEEKKKNKTETKGIAPTTRPSETQVKSHQESSRFSLGLYNDR